VSKISPNFQILFQQTLKKAAHAMFYDAERGFLLQNVTIAVPSNWDTSGCGNRTFVPSVLKKPDVRIGPIHPVYKNTPWTQQSKACGARGDYISLSDAYFTDSNYTEDERARLLFRMWMRYRLGVFDDSSCKKGSDPEVCGSDLKVDTKHRNLCPNKDPSWMLKNIVKGNKFDKNQYVGPTFTYQKPIEPKLVIAFDSTMPQDEWSMTRAAFRSMLDYLTSDLELGLFGYYGKSSIQVYQDITLVTPNPDDFQNLTNKIYAQPTQGFKRSNITRALEQAVKMLQANESSAAGHSVFVIATKGSMNRTELERATKFAEMAKIRVSVIGVGLEQDEFYNFALLTEKTDGRFRNVAIHKTNGTNGTYTNISLLIDIEDGLVSALRAHGKEVGNSLLYSTKLTTINAGNLKGKFVYLFTSLHTVVCLLQSI
jgi:Calcium-activated chloride channel N terminal